MPLTDMEIQAFTPTVKAARHFDAEGLYLEVAPAGGKWWRFKYRFGGKEKRLALGTYPRVSLKQARKFRNDARALLLQGIDPSEVKKAKVSAMSDRTSNSFETIGREWFAKNAPGWNESHSSRVLRLLERDVFPWLGKRPIAEIKPPELLSVLRRIEDRGALETAHRALRNCGQVFRYAMATGVAPVDPTGALKGALPPVSEGHFAAVTAPPRLAVLLRIMDGYEGTLPVRCALRLAPLLFVRPGELRKAEWKDIDFDSAEWRYRSSKTQTDHIVPLSRQALSILRELRPLTGSSRFVFPSARGNGRPMSDNALLAAMRSMGIGKTELTTHGFRATARTILDEVLKVRPDYIEHQLAHAVRDPNGRAYNRTAFLPERHEMMQMWSDYLDELKSRVEN